MKIKYLTIITENIPIEYKLRHNFHSTRISNLTYSCLFINKTIIITVKPIIKLSKKIT